MVTTTLNDGGRISRREARAGAAKVHVGRIGLGTVGLVTVLISAWGGIIPYVGPAFGYSADGTGSWHWSLSHSVLGLVPGAPGVLIGLAILGRPPGPGPEATRSPCGGRFTRRLKQDVMDAI